MGNEQFHYKIVAVPWSKNEQEYQAIVSMFPPAQRNDAISYRAFISEIQSAEKKYQRVGIITDRVTISAVELRAWCDKNHLKVCPESFNKFGWAKLDDNYSGSAIIREKMAKACREINDYSVSLFRNNVPHGSGTLVSLGNVCGILTAHHVSDLALKVKGGDADALTLVFAEHVHRFEIPLHGDPFKRLYEEVVVGAFHQSHESQGPDLAFIHLFDPDKLSVLKSKKLFYPLEHAKLNTMRDLRYQQMPWWIWGAPAERISTEHPSQGGEFLARVQHFCGQVTFLDEMCSNSFDYVRLKINTGQDRFPADCKGMSGGGVWLTPPNGNRDGGLALLEFKAPILTGVAFYQSEDQNQSRIITCHGPASIYEALLQAIQRHT
ncbi:MAG TPA: hypothetical protein VFC44_01250 [Candidatus Saccharimonadales bacterium]|nr:hypothetical protein [Candidatus Saccharimonadales bacterium]